MNYLTVTSIIALLVLPVVVLLCPKVARYAGRLTFRVIRPVSRRPRLAILICGLSTFGINAGFGLFVTMPLPAVHDEHAYLLTADTFASGRLTNPTHPHFKHFDSWQIIHEPSYQAKYPPAQGVFLAAGQRLFGHPVYGVWLSMALAAAAVCWMLQGWLSARWAFLGGLAFALNDTCMMHWGQTYWGGAVAFLGGALLYGAMKRLTTDETLTDRKLLAWNSVLLATGIGILANSRPWEGLLATIPAVIVLIGYAVRSDLFRRKQLWMHSIVPAAVVLFAFGTATGLYNHAVTGSPWRMPYQEWGAQQSVSLSLMTVGQLDPEGPPGTTRPVSNNIARQSHGVTRHETDHPDSVL